MTHEQSAPQRATLSQVAALAGVSLKTASRVMNDEPYVTAATAERVRRAAAQLGFRPNALARDFRAGAHNPSVGLVIGDVANPFYSRIARGAELRLREAGLRLVTASSGEDATLERALVDEMLERRVSGLMIVTAADDHGWVEPERRLGTPVVFLDRAPEDVAADSILLDNESGIRAAVEHLVAAGHRRIGFIGDLSRLPTHRERVQAFRAAMTAASLDPEAYLVADRHDTDAAEAATRELLARPEPPTAIITANNRLTIGAVRAVGIAPRRAALVGFDDVELADLLGLSVVSHDPERMGRVAAETVLARLAGDRSAPRGVRLPTRLVVRDSSGAGPTH